MPEDERKERKEGEGRRKGRSGEREKWGEGGVHGKREKWGGDECMGRGRSGEGEE